MFKLNYYGVRLAVCAVALSLSLPAQAQMFGMGGPSEVGVVTLETTQVPYTTTIPGRAKAFEEVDIRPRVSGVIAEIAYEPGREVSVGDVLFRIDGDTYEAEVSAAEAEVDRAEAAVRASEATLERYQRLEGSAIASSEVDNAEVAVLQNKASLKSAQAALETARLNLERTNITSPISGIAEIAEVSVGTVVTANQADALARVTRIDPIYVDVQESSQQIETMRGRIESGALQTLGQLQISLRTEAGQELEGTGRIVSPEYRVSTTTGTSVLRLQFDNPGQWVIPGQFLRVEITYGQSEAILVPQGATSRNSDGTLIAYVAKDGIAEQRVLTTEGVYQNAWITTAGVEAGELLVVDGRARLHGGAEVTTVPVEISENGVVQRTDGGSDAFGAAPVAPAPEAAPEGEAAPAADEEGEAPAESGGN